MNKKGGRGYRPLIAKSKLNDYAHGLFSFFYYFISPWLLYYRHVTNGAKNQVGKADKRPVEVLGIAVRRSARLHWGELAGLQEGSQGKEKGGWR